LPYVILSLTFWMRYQCSSSSPLEHRSLLLVRHLELFFNKGAMLLSQNQPIAALYPPLVAGLPPFW